MKLLLIAQAILALFMYVSASRQTLRFMRNGFTGLRKISVGNLQHQETFLKTRQTEEVTDLSQLMILIFNINMNNVIDDYGFQERRCWTSFFDQNLLKKPLKKGRLATVFQCSRKPHFSHKRIFVDDYEKAYNISSSKALKSQIVDLDETSNKNHQLKCHGKESKDCSPYNLYKHYSILCPRDHRWCWCGVVSNLQEYYGMAVHTSYFRPLVVIDCRPFEMRPFEKRSCSEDSVPWLERNIGKTEFPCGSVGTVIEMHV